MATYNQTHNQVLGANSEFREALSSAPKAWQIKQMNDAALERYDRAMEHQLFNHGTPEHMDPRIRDLYKNKSLSARSRQEQVQQLAAKDDAANTLKNFWGGAAGTGAGAGGMWDDFGMGGYDDPNDGYSPDQSNQTIDRNNQLDDIRGDDSSDEEPGEDIPENRKDEPGEDGLDGKNKKDDEEEANSLNAETQEGVEARSGATPPEGDKTVPGLGGSGKEGAVATGAGGKTVGAAGDAVAGGATPAAAGAAAPGAAAGAAAAPAAAEGAVIAGAAGPEIALAVLAIVIFVILLVSFFTAFYVKYPDAAKANETSEKATVICVDPGHPSSTEGAGGEKELNFKVATELKPALEAKGYTVFITKSSVGENVDNQERAKKCAAAGGTYMLSLHADDTGSKTDFPYLIYANNKRGIYEQSKKDAEAVRKGLIDTLSSAGYIGSELKGKANCEENVCTGATDLGVYVGGDAKGLSVDIVEMVKLSGGSSWLDNNTHRAKFVEGLVVGISSAHPPTSTSGSGGKMTKVPYYTQGGGKPWSQNSYGCGTTIAQAGCGITSLAMVISYWTGKEVLPSETAKLSLKKGWRICGSGTSWSAMTAMPKIYGLQSKQISSSWSVVKSYLDKGYTVIQSHGPGCFTKGGHFIVLTGYSGTKVYVNDPNSSHKSYRNGVSLSCVTSSVKASWVIWK